jgi:molybdopterin-binding protein
MSAVQAVVSGIENEKNLNLVTFDFGPHRLWMMSLDLGGGIEVGKKVILEAKPSHIAIGLGRCEDISYSNKLPCKIRNIQEGRLLGVVELACEDAHLESIITVRSLRKMQLHEGLDVTAYIKASELSIKEVCDD